MKPFLGAESTIRVGVDTIIEATAPDGQRGVVFEDDGNTGYFYARDFSQPDLLFIDALHVYDVAAVSDSDRPSVVKIIWTCDFMAAALLINQRPHVIFHFGERCGYAEKPFPEPDSNSGWTHGIIHSSLRELFHPTEDKTENNKGGINSVTASPLHRFTST